MFDTALSRGLEQTLDHFRRETDRLFNGWAGGSPYEQHNTGLAGSPAEGYGNWFRPMMESHWTDQALILRAILPGVSEDDVSVTLHNNRLVIEGQRRGPSQIGAGDRGVDTTAERSGSEGKDRGGWLAGWNGSRLAYGRFQTSIALPQGLDLEAVRCHMRDGVLDVILPLAEQMRPRQIPVQAASAQKAIAV